MLTKTFSTTLDGIEGSPIQIESIRLNSLPQIVITGLPGEAVKESRERVRACLVNLGFDVPSGKIVVHLSPANVKKEGSHYDLAIAVSVLAAESKIPQSSLENYGFLGELALNGSLCPVGGALPLIEALVKNQKLQRIVIPKENEAEASLLDCDRIFVANDLGDVLDFINQRKLLPNCHKVAFQTQSSAINLFDGIVGQCLAKRALQISLAGAHHLLLVGPPGVGKSMLSQAAGELLPPLMPEDFIQLLKVYSASSVEIDSLVKFRRRPYRSPHHGISANALLGGGSAKVIPGEISLAHCGVLFLDELPEFRRDAIEGLREPLQCGYVQLSRVRGNLTLPAKFSLLAAMNPCPCGMYSPVENRCRCTPDKKAQYRRKLSTPILDRIALMVQMNQADLNPIPEREALSFHEVKSSIEQVCEIQRRRGQVIGQTNEGEINYQHLDLRLDEKSEELLKVWQKKCRLSFRRAFQIIRVARTIADLSHEPRIGIAHLREAWDLRCFDFYQSY